jgi:enamine deaminase RidA (YjgF/YER057c/UK114 family)
MAHRRIRKFNTKATYPEQKLDNDLCQAVVAGNTVYLRGQIAQDLDTRASLHVGDAGKLADKAMSIIAMLLDEAGSELGLLVKIVVYLTDIRYREAVYRSMGRWLKGVFPVSTGLVVQALARPEWVVEIDATAVIPEGYKPKKKANRPRPTSRKPRRRSILSTLNSQLSTPSSPRSASRPPPP